MRSDHRPVYHPLEQPYRAADVDWQAPRWPAWLRVTIIAAGSLMAWTAILGLALAIGVIARG